MIYSTVFRQNISIHALRVEGDSPARLTWLSAHWPFLSTPSGWRATQGARLPNCTVHISIHALRVEGDIVLNKWYDIDRISIHALRVEGDVGLLLYPYKITISIHALRVEGDAKDATVDLSVQNVFLSTPSGWRATRAAAGLVGCALISIHALRVEGDGEHMEQLNSKFKFLSTPSGWRATRKCCTCLLVVVYFYPRPPGGGRRGLK